MSILIILSLTCIYVNGMENIVKTKQFEIPSQGSPLPPSEKFLDIYPLTVDNFTESVMNNHDPWVIIFHQGFIPRAWKTMAASLRGSTWFGMIDIESEAKLVKKIKYVNSTENLARVYPYGTAIKKKENWKYVKNAEEARLSVIECLPDTVLKIKGKDVQDFLFESFANRPSKFPAVFFTNDDVTPSFMKAIAIRFQKYFNFARFVLPTVEDLKAIGLQDEIIDLPALYILVTPDSGPSEDMSFSAIEYRPAVMGGMNYPNILQFLFIVNHQFRHNLQGDNKSDNKTIMNMEDIIDIEEKRFSIRVRGRKQVSKTEKKSTETKKENQSTKPTDENKEDKTKESSVENVKDEL